MTKSRILIVLAVVLGGVSFYLNQDRFAKQQIQILHRSRPDRSGASAGQAIDPIFFAFNRNLNLTLLKVIAVREIETNKYPRPMWHLVSDSNSVPTADFCYGVPIGGMRPAVKDAVPDPLEPGVKYRLLIEAGKIKAEHDFTPVGRRL
jgi:hypothetical protein